jgi:hypothetical protein
LKLSIYFGCAAAVICIAASAPSHADPCMKVTLTGVQGGPPVFKGQAGAGKTFAPEDEAKEVWRSG